MANIDVQRAIFDPIERAILSDYFGVERAEDIRDIDIHAATDDRDPSSRARRVRIRPDQSGETGEHTLGNAVARLALNTIRERLPQWYQGYGDGTYILGRDPEPGLRRDVPLKPVHLFTINWADSGPGYSWPVAFYAAWIPGFDRFVVTSSADSEDADGYTDITLGWFPGSTPILKGSRQVLVKYWRSIAYYQHKWQDFLESGLVDEVVANKWVRGVLRKAEEF